MNPSDNTLWNVTLLGRPTAQSQEGTVCLRSRKSWAVLAALLLESPHPAESSVGLTRSHISNMFWPDSANGRDSLRQVIYSLRSWFGNDLIAGKDGSIRIEASRFVTDIRVIEEIASRIGSGSCTDGQRLEMLHEVFRLAKGEFLEGCIDYADPAFEWYAKVKLRIERRIVKLLAQYCDLLEQRGHNQDAFLVARKIVRYSPGEQRAEIKAAMLAREAGLLIKHPGRAAANMQERLEFESRALANERLKHASMAQRIGTLKPSDRAQLRSLCELAQPFTAAMAKAACHTTGTALDRLHNTGLLENSIPHTYSVINHQMVCNAIPATIKKRRTIWLRAAEATIKWLYEPQTRGQFEHNLFPNDPMASSTIRLLLERFTTFGPGEPVLFLIDQACQHGYRQLVSPCIPLLEELSDSNHLDTAMKALIFHTRAQIASSDGHFGQAALLLERGLELHSQNEETNYALLVGLPVAWHHAGCFVRALHWCRAGYEAARASNDLTEMARFMRFMAEIHSVNSDITPVLDCLNQALLHYRESGKHSPLSAAECYYQMAIAHLKVGQLDAALAEADEDYLVRREYNDDVGTAQCAAVYAEICLARGDCGQALAHIEHALLIYQNNDKPASIAASLITRGDILMGMHKHSEAACDYREALTYWKEQGHERWIKICESRLTRR
jgi:tetratricopeptide (TPR) repeat protein